jgi:hypothetical protein
MTARHPPCTVLVLLAAALAPACDTFPPASELGDEPQVLALRATPPELPPGATVTLDALVHWPGGAPTLSWLVCLPDVADNVLSCLPSHLPAGAPPPACADDPAARVCVAGIGDVVAYTVPADAFPDDGAPHTIFVYLLASAAPAGFLQCADTLAGGPPTLDCLLSIKRVVISTRDPANRNPVVTALVIDGVTVDPSAIAEVDVATTDLENLALTLGVTLDATSVDELVAPSAPAAPADAATRLTVQWFTTCGSVADPIVYLDITVDDAGGLGYDTALTKWKPGQAGACTVHAVVRDAAGGAGYISQQVSISGPFAPGQQSRQRRWHRLSRRSPVARNPAARPWRP